MGGTEKSQRIFVRKLLEEWLVTWKTKEMGGWYYSES
jgi:hypothetical protein